MEFNLPVGISLFKSYINAHSIKNPGYLIKQLMNEIIKEKAELNQVDQNLLAALLEHLIKYSAVEEEKGDKPVIKELLKVYNNLLFAPHLINIEADKNLILIALDVVYKGVNQENLSCFYDKLITFDFTKVKEVVNDISQLCETFANIKNIKEFTQQIYQQAVISTIKDNIDILSVLGFICPGSEIEYKEFIELTKKLCTEAITEAEKIEKQVNVMIANIDNLDNGLYIEILENVFKSKSSASNTNKELFENIKKIIHSEEGNVIKIGLYAMSNELKYWSKKALGSKEVEVNSYDNNSNMEAGVQKFNQGIYNNSYQMLIDKIKKFSKENIDEIKSKLNEEDAKEFNKLLISHICNVLKLTAELPLFNTQIAELDIVIMQIEQSLEAEYDENDKGKEEKYEANNSFFESDVAGQFEDSSDE